MSSSFFNVLKKAKENTKQIVENASAHMSVKLQMHVNSSPPMPHKYPSISTSRDTISVKNDLETKSPHNLFPEKDNAINVNSTSNPSVKYSEPLSIAKTCEVRDVTPTDINEFLISKSTEVYLNKTIASNLNYIESLIENKISLVAADSNPPLANSTSSSMSISVVNKESSLFPKTDINSKTSTSGPYNCNSKDCNLPSCHSKISSTSTLENKSSKASTENSCFENQNVVRDMPPEMPFSTVEPTNEISYNFSEGLVLDNNEEFSLNVPEMCTINEKTDSKVYSNREFSQAPIQTVDQNSLVNIVPDSDIFINVPKFSETLATNLELHENVLESSEKLASNVHLPEIISESHNLNSPRSQHIFAACNPRRVCIFCGSKEHNSHNCKKFNHSSQFWTVVYNEKRCKNCLRQFHFSNHCFDSSFCLISNCRRRDKHSPILCKFRYMSSNFSPKSSKLQSYSFKNCNVSSHHSSESYQDILNGGSFPNQNCFSQGTQTNVLELKSIHTQTAISHNNLEFIETTCDSASKKIIQTTSNIFDLNENNSFVNSNATSLNPYISTSSEFAISPIQLSVATTVTADLCCSPIVSTVSTSSPIMSTCSETLVCNLAAGNPVSSPSFVYDPDEFSRRFIAEMIPKLRQLPKGDWCANSYL